MADKIRDGDAYDDLNLINTGLMEDKMKETMQFNSTFYKVKNRNMKQKAH